MRVIFLDIDGVLNNSMWCEDNPFTLGVDGWQSQLSPNLMMLMNKIVKQTDATVVLSSTWRFGWTCDDLQVLMDNAHGTFHLHDRTPIEVKGRADAIYEWLDRYGEGVTSWIAIDDCESLTELGERWVRTFDGLTPEIAQTAVETLIRLEVEC